MKLDFSEKIIFGAFGAFIAFLLFERLFGAFAAIWSFRVLVAGGTIGVAVYVFQSGGDQGHGGGRGNPDCERPPGDSDV